LRKKDLVDFMAHDHYGYDSILAIRSLVVTVYDETTESFVKRIRRAATEKTCTTSGICVFEHHDESSLEDDEKGILETLRQAHERWQMQNGKIT
jgi:hypothetical protein